MSKQCQEFSYEVRLRNTTTFPSEMSRAFKEDHLLEVLKLFGEEFNKPDLHDRVLVFDVVFPRRKSSVTATDSKDDQQDEVNISEIGMNTNKTESHLTTQQEMNRKATRVGTFEVCVSAHVALRTFIMQVLVSQLPFLAKRNTELVAWPLFWPVDSIQ